ncbi:hypothetical protein Hanom_Chr17g01558781 [Helianthus anomalus]
MKGLPFGPNKLDPKGLPFGPNKLNSNGLAPMNGPPAWPNGLGCNIPPSGFVKKGSSNGSLSPNRLGIPLKPAKGSKDPKKGSPLPLPLPPCISSKNST